MYTGRPYQASNQYFIRTDPIILSVDNYLNINNILNTIHNFEQFICPVKINATCTDAGMRYPTDINILQSHERPIVRVKVGRKSEYGAKIGVSVVNGFTYIDHLSWDAYNEGADPMIQIITYKERFGYYPQDVQADKIYLNKENRKLLKKLGIVCHCPPLGRPKKNPDQEEEKLRRKASGERNGVEATFGTTKRVYRANNIRAKLKETARTWIAACFFAKNLKKFLMVLLCLFWEKSLRSQQIFNIIGTGDYFGKPCAI